MGAITRERLEALRSLVQNVMPDSLGVRVVDRGEDLGAKGLKNAGEAARLFLWTLANSRAESLLAEVPARPVFFAQLDWERGGDPAFLNPADFMGHVARLQLYVAETRQALQVFASRKYMSRDGLTLDSIALEYSPQAHEVLRKCGAIQPAGDSPQG